MLAALILCSCTDHKEENPAPTISVKLPEVIATSIETPESRTSINSAGSIAWGSTDRITLYPGINTGSEYRYNGNGEFARVTTETKAVGSKINRCYAVYPHSAENLISLTGELTLTLPATQPYAKGSFGQGANVMVAAVDNLAKAGSLQFQNIGGYLKILLYGTNATIKSCSIKGNNGEKIAGRAYVRTTPSTTPSVTMAEDATESVTIDCGSKGIAIGTSEQSATPFWFVLPETTFTNGYTITIVDNNGVSFTKKINESLTIERNTVLSTTAIKTKLSGDGLEFIDNKVRFYLSELANSTRSVSGIAARNWETSTLLVNNKEYSILFDEDDIPYVDVEINSNNSYSATLLTSKSEEHYITSPYVGLKVSPSQFQNASAATIASFPMYANYSVSTGNRLIFKDCFSLIHLKLKGTAKISSIRVENLSGAVIAGPVGVNRSSGNVTLSRGLSFANLNCTNGGSCVQLSNNVATDFYVMVAPKNCSKGLSITISDTKRLAMFLSMPATELEASRVYTFEETYAPESSMVFYEGYDNFVWGGDIVRGSGGYGFSPDDTTIEKTSCLDRTGYEEALTEVAYDNPGSGFIQSDTWNDNSGQTVDTSHQVSDSYVKSRCLEGTQYMFRVQEFPGYIGVGTASTARGIYSSPMMQGMTGIGTVNVKVRFAMQAGFDGTLQAIITLGGVISAATLDGTPLTLSSNNCYYSSINSALEIDSSKLKIASNATSSKAWHTLELVVDNATDGTRVYMTDKNSGTGVHGIYIDSIEAHKVNEWSRPANTLRVLLWNIQNGMWADQHNGYDNFVRWVKKYDPDICIWCESETIYHDKTNTGKDAADRYLPDGWKYLCPRYGHSYAANGGNRDNYSQTVTSKYPITILQQITGPSSKPVSHGAGHFTVTVNGKKINIVTLHMWPQAYGYGVSSSNRETSKANREGDYYRQYEMQYIVDNTIKKSEYANEELWLFGGDTNSRSRKDAWYYSFPSDDPIYLTHDILLEQTKLKDVIADYYPSNYFFSSTSGNSRIDMLYTSPAMFDRIILSTTLIDSWTNICDIHEFCKNWSSNKFRDPSDHRPILVDFKMD